MNDQLVIDNWSGQLHETRSYFYGPVSRKNGMFEYKANTKVEIFVVFCNVLGSATEEEVSIKFA